jgi:hypothetical protein
VDLDATLLLRLADGRKPRRIRRTCAGAAKTVPLANAETALFHTQTDLRDFPGFFFNQKHQGGVAQAK